MEKTDVLVIGAGQAGLAMSRCLTATGTDHLVVDRGRVGERWRSERWDSLRLLTPNWSTRLPGSAYEGDNPDGFMSASELVSYFEDYAQSFAAPIRPGVTVRTVEPSAGGLAVRAEEESWLARNVVIATGWSDQPSVPRWSRRLDGDVNQLTPSSYRNPAQLPDGNVLVVGASASGVQLAEELTRAGRDVVLAVGTHTRVPRVYRGLDIWWWLDQIGALSETIDTSRNPSQARREGSFQLVGAADSHERRDVDLPALQQAGVRLAGRLVDADGSTVTFADDLDATTAAADQKMQSLLARIEAHIDSRKLHHLLPSPAPVTSVVVDHALPQLDLRASGITTVIWATGYHRPYHWLRIPVRDRSGEISQRRGVTRYPGLYVLGQRFQYRRDSNFIGGVGYDAEFIAGHIARRAAPRHERPRQPAA